MTNKRGKYASPRQIDRRQRILQAAGTLLEQEGLETLSMNKIADLSDVAVKTLYNQFGSRDLLLLEAAAEVLVDHGQSEVINKIEAGLPRLLNYVVGTMVGFASRPRYAQAIISILVKTDLEPELADIQMGVVRRFAEDALGIAAEKKELRAGVKIPLLAQHISANQWGAVLLWEKDLLDVTDLANHVARSHYMTLLPVVVGDRRGKMEAEFEALLSKSGLVGEAQNPKDSL